MIRESSDGGSSDSVSTTDGSSEGINAERVGGTTTSATTDTTTARKQYWDERDNEPSGTNTRTDATDRGVSGDGDTR